MAILSETMCARVLTLVLQETFGFKEKYKESVTRKTKDTIMESIMKVKNI